MQNKITLSIIIVHYRNFKVITSCISSLKKGLRGIKSEIIVVDNDENKFFQPNYKELLKGIIYIKSQQNIGYGAAVNAGAKYAKGKYILVSNPDTVFFKETLREMLIFFKKNREVGMVGPTLLDKRRKIYKQIGSSSLNPLVGIVALSFLNKIFPNNPISRHYWLRDRDFSRPQEVDVVPGSCFMIRKQVFDQVGGFDPNFFLYFEESDLCKRVKEKRWKIFIIPDAKVIHYWGASTPKSQKINKIFQQSRFYYFKKHYGIIWALVVESFARFSKRFAVSSLIFWYLILFPFGQLPKLIFQFLGFPYQFHIADFLALGILLINLPLKFSRYAKNLILIFVCSWIFSLTTFGKNSINPGGLYLVRFISYLGFFYIIYDLVCRKILQKYILVKSLIGICVAMGILGWIQLLVVPDLTTLYLLGWDDHYYRLVSTFLDPAFTGVILLIGSWVSYKYYLFAKNLRYLIITIFLALTIIPTYSRATYLAALVLIILSFLKNKIRKIHAFLFILVFVSILILIPKPLGEGGNLLRTKSMQLKLENSYVALQIIKSNPMFGVGFNNICIAKQNLGFKNDSHNACSGIDNSILFILATTGISGLLVFIGFIFEVIKNTSKNYLGQIFLGTLIVVFVHGQFTNTFFYPWVMGSLALLGGISRTKENN